MSSSQHEKAEIVHRSASGEHIPYHKAVEGHVPKHISNGGDQYGNNKDGIRRRLHRRTFTENGLAPQLHIKDMQRTDAFKPSMEKAAEIERGLLIEDVSIKNIQLLYSQ